MKICGALQMHAIAISTIITIKILRHFQNACRQKYDENQGIKRQFSLALASYIDLIYISIKGTL